MVWFFGINPDFAVLISGQKVVDMPCEGEHLFGEKIDDALNNMKEDSETAKSLTALQDPLYSYLSLEAEGYIQQLSIILRCSEVKALKPQEDAPGMETPLQSTTRHAHLQEKLTELKEIFPAEMDWRYVKSCEREVTLDPGTANPWLIVSADGRRVRRGPRAQDLPDTPQRFTKALCVLGREGLSSGRHYWEVGVGGNPTGPWGCVMSLFPGRGRLQHHLRMDSGQWRSRLVNTGLSPPIPPP
ncbi:E3 ubiquitin-protein ligase TRIM11-like [Ambystoma mexicanum]|uniref:E3 ubiquitin-protein ligase TRIM11-like n=1 Tax=Ambystoma mexicanum TaxID=8296 RepID=UPI0037E8C643